MFTAMEATARWSRVRMMMAAQDLDLVLAIDCSPDETLHANLRWLTGFVARGPAAVLLHRDGAVELISERVGKTLIDYYLDRDIPIDLVAGFSPSLLADRVARYHPRRIGIAEPEYLSAAIADALAHRMPSTTQVDAFSWFLELRLRKSAYELDLVRRSCAIADRVWESVADIVKIGRKNYEIIADVDHLVKLEGAEGGFHLLQTLPFGGRPLTVLVNDEPVEPRSRYLMEISPRFDGYYSQLTIPITSRANDDTALCAHRDIVKAKEAAQPRMMAGADLSQVAVFVEQFLAERGHTLTSPSLGHFCGMALNEPRHDPKHPCILAEDMTLIFHPVLADEEIRSMMRGETYAITPSGAVKLNHYRNEMLSIA